MNNIIIVGGGTSGLISALILRKSFPSKKITLIQSSQKGIVGVGESSTEHLKDFCNFVGLPLLDFIVHANATFKDGIYFSGWSESDYTHNLREYWLNNQGTYYPVFGYVISSDLGPAYMQPMASLRNELPLDCFNNWNDSPTYQFQFDTFALNNYLSTICNQRSIEIVLDDLNNVEHDENGNITCVVSDIRKYCADFFIDCSGFERFLSKDIPWKSYSEYLPLNSAVTFETEEMEGYSLYTHATARNSGWSWKIATQKRTGNGYVFCDKFIDEDEVHREMEEAYGQELNISKTFKFDPGRLENAWNKNCYSVGLSQSFVEPLEATSIANTINTMFCFVNSFPSYDAIICNKQVNAVYDNIFDFVQAHYLVKREDTPFWKAIKYDLKLTPTLESYLEMWKHRLPKDTDFQCPFGVFGPQNYIQVLYGLKWFDIDKIKKEFLFYEIEEVVEKNFWDNQKAEKNIFWIKHKDCIRMIKEGVR